MRYKCICSYDGSLFHGFQSQRNQRTIQDVIENALFLSINERITIYSSGRTDAGVHALAQVFHFDSVINISSYNMKKAINSRLPKDVYINSVETVDNKFHARFNAVSKEYHYFIDFGNYNPLLGNYRYFCNYRKVDNNAFLDALQLFVGKHDFRYFSRSKKNDNTVREIFHISSIKEQTLIKIKIVGEGFLHNMVRMIIAAALEVARGKITLEDIKSSLDKDQPLKAPKKLPANGLYLVSVNYSNI